MKKLFFGLLMFLVCIGGGTFAWAVPLSLQSTITFGGTLRPGSNLQTATSLDFVSPTFVTSASGNFAAFVSPGNLATFRDFSFTPFSGTDNPVWTAGGFQFDLQSVTVDSQGNSGLVLLGSGVVSGNGYTSTPFNFSFSADRISSAVAFSATTAPVVTPEPGTLLLLGSALVFGGLRMKRRS